MRCKDCGEFVDWSNPNIHYGGHSCEARQNQAKETDSNPLNKLNVTRNIEWGEKELEIILVLLNERIAELRNSKTRDNCKYFELCNLKAKIDLWLFEGGGNDG